PRSGVARAAVTFMDQRLLLPSSFTAATTAPAIVSGCIGGGISRKGSFFTAIGDFDTRNKLAQIARRDRLIAFQSTDYFDELSDMLSKLNILLPDGSIFDDKHR